jgi:hypothetical protein
MQSKARGRSRQKVNAVVTRGDGSVEDWGQITHPSAWHELLYAIRHPIIIFNRQRWRLKQWFLKYKTQA